MSLNNHLLLAILTFPILISLILPLLRGKWAGYVGGIAALTAGLAFLMSLALIPALCRGGFIAFSRPWIPSLGIGFALRVDWLGLLFLLNLTGVTTLSLVYAWGYMRHRENLAAFYALMLAFMYGMAGAVLAADMLLFYIFWEVMLLGSCALIALWGDGPRAQSVALKYFIFTHIGSLLLLMSILCLFTRTGESDIYALRALLGEVDVGLLKVLFLLLTIGFGVKMAIFPLHTWLPDAHSIAPMPVTVMLAAAMLSMGLYGMMRFLPAFPAPVMEFFSLPLLVAGVLSQFYGGMMALAEKEAKRIIAYSSVSQMGYALFGMATLAELGMRGSVLHIVNHGIVKALLFLCVGVVMHATGRRLVAQLGGLAGRMPLTALCCGVGALAIAGAPPFCGFHSEWMIFAGGFATPHTLLAALATIAPALTAGYALWFVARVFFGPSPQSLSVKDDTPRSMLAPVVFLSILALAAGLYPAPLYALAERAIASLGMGG